MSHLGPYCIDAGDDAMALVLGVGLLWTVMLIAFAIREVKR